MELQIVRFAAKDYCAKSKRWVFVDDSNEKLGYRLRQSQLEKVPYTLVIGDAEVKDNLVTYRAFGSEKQIQCSANEFLALLKDEIKNKDKKA